MDWMHLAELLGIAAASGLAHMKGRKAKAAVTAKELAAEAAELAMQRALDELEQEAQKAAALFEHLLKQKMGTKTAGGALLTKLAVERERAIRKGKELALKTYREKMAAP